MKLSMPWNNKPVKSLADRVASAPDDQSGNVYLLDTDLKLAVETALVVERPLLLSGPPGCGKSSLAPFVARNLNWRFYDFNLQRRTQSKDLLWQFDAMARLRDAQAGVPLDQMTVEQYLTPGVFWWAINYKDASRLIEKRVSGGRASILPPNHELNKRRDPFRAVLLIDEIDKADPDLPGDMLDLIAEYKFVVEENGHLVERCLEDKKSSQPLTDISKANGPLIIFTTNEERDLSPAFTRRCVKCSIKKPKKENLLRIAKLQFGTTTFDQHALLAESLADKCESLANASRTTESASGPSIAEYLDALRACIMLGIDANDGDDNWKHLINCTLAKR